MGATLIRMAIEIFLEYEGELRTRAVHGPSSTTLVTDAPVDNHGRGESFSPTDLVATALGSCMLTLMGLAARARDLDISGTRVRIEKHMVADPQRRIERLPAQIEVPRPIPPEHRAALEHAAETCPVRLSIHPRIDVPLQFAWTDPTE